MDWVIPFTVTVPGDWAQGESATANAVDIVDGTGLRYVFTVIRKSPDAPEVWVERLTTAEYVQVSEPEPVEIGGAPGHVFDAQLRDDTPDCVVGGSEFGKACYVIHGPEDGWAWLLEEGRSARMWVLDVNGDTVVMYSDSREDRYEAWVAVIEEVVATIRWPGP